MAFVLERADTCEIVVAPLDGSAPPATVSAGADFAFDPAWSPDGRALYWHEWDQPDMPWDGSRVVRRGIDGLSPSGPVEALAGGDGVAVGQPRPSPGGSALGYVCDRTGWPVVWTAAPDGRQARPVLEDEHEHAEPAWGPGQRSWAWSPDGAALAICRNEAGAGRLVVASRSGTVLGGVAGWHHGIEWGPAGIVAVRSGPREPPAVAVAAGGAERVVARAAVGDLDGTIPVEPEPVCWAGADGGTVHGLLWRARERARTGPPPLLVSLHGGPTGQAVAGWSPRLAFFLDRGWAVLTPNPRGSTGYGRAYTQALAGRWGELDVADVAAGIRRATERAWGDPGRVAAMGSSAGGLVALLLAARHPGLLRAVAVSYPVTDLLDLAATTHRFEARYLDRLVGPLPVAAGRYRQRSPVAHADRITTPLLLLQGDQDPVVSPAQADALRDALERAGTPVEHHRYEGEGHGWRRPGTVEDALARTAAFLERRVLGP